MMRHILALVAALALVVSIPLVASAHCGTCGAGEAAAEEGTEACGHAEGDEADCDCEDGCAGDEAVEGGDEAACGGCDGAHEGCEHCAGNEAAECDCADEGCEHCAGDEAAECDCPHEG